MKIIHLSLTIVFLLLTMSCNAQKSLDLKDTKWVYDFGGGYKSYYLFTEHGKYEYFDAELGELLKGTFMIQNDTVFLNQETGQYDSEFKETSRHRTENRQLKLVVKNYKELADSSYWDQEGNKWKDGAFIFVKE